MKKVSLPPGISAREPGGLPRPKTLAGGMAFGRLPVLLPMLFTQALCQPDIPARVEAVFSVAQYRQAVRVEGEKSEIRLVDDYLLSAQLSGSFQIGEYMAMGAFLQFDEGLRSAADFVALDLRGRPRSGNARAGAYSEFWLGPLIQVFRRPLQAELGFAALGLYQDHVRSDLHAESGGNDGTFAWRLGTAWMFSFGADLPVHAGYSLVAKLQYRTRVLDSREGKPLEQGLEVPMQSVAPYIGVSLRF